MLRNAMEPWHLLVLGIVVILVFGSKKLPDSARALGKSLRILKSETRAMHKESQADPAPAAQPARADAPSAADSPSASGPAAVSRRA